MPRSAVERASGPFGVDSFRLNPQPHWLVLPNALPPQIIANCAIIYLDEFTPAAESWFTWRDILHLVDIVCCCLVLFPIVWSIKQLRDASGGCWGGVGQAFEWRGGGCRLVGVAVWRVSARDAASSAGVHACSLCALPCRSWLQRRTARWCVRWSSSPSSASSTSW